MPFHLTVEGAVDVADDVVLAVVTVHFQGASSGLSRDVGDLRVRRCELIDAGEDIISVVTSRARGRSSGVEVEWAEQVAVWTIRNSRVVRVLWLPTREEALEAVGLSE